MLIVKSECALLFKTLAKSLFVLALLITVSLSKADEMQIPSDEEISSSIPKNWREIEDLQQRKVPIQLLIAAIKSNEKQISTYKSKYIIESDYRYDRSLLNSERIFDIIFESDPLWHHKYEVDVVSDRIHSKIYRKAKILEKYFDYEGKKIGEDPELLRGKISIDTQKEYVYMETGQFFQGVDNELPGHSNVPADNIAWVESTEYNDNKTVDDNIDPYKFFRIEYWASLDMMLDVMNGKRGEEKESHEYIHVFETTDGTGAKWFRYQQLLDDHNELNILWNEKSSFLPVYMTTNTESGVFNSFVQVEWIRDNDLFVPSKSSVVLRSSDGELQTRCRISVSDIHINDPVDQGQFSYGALGLKGESLIVNRIQNKVYTLKNGKPVFLADFYTKQKEDHNDLHFGSTRIICVLLGVVLIVLGIFLRRRKMKTAA